MSTTQAVFLQTVAEEMGDYFTADTTGAGDTDTLVSTALIDLPNGDDDDAFNGWYLKITESGHCAEGEVRRISDYTGATGSADVTRAFSAATGSGTAFELYRYDPEDYLVAIRRAISGSYPALYRTVIDESIVIDNLLLNPGFETFSAGFTNWTAVGSPTVTQETTTVLHGDSAAKVVSAAGCTDGQLTQTVLFPFNSVTDKFVYFYCWVYATAGCVARIRIDWDGCDIDNSDYHSGADQWELLQINAADVPAGATQVKFICEVEAGSNTAYFDAAAGWCDNVYRYDLPATFDEYPSFVTIQADINNPNGRYWPIVTPPTSGRRVRIEGMGALTIPSADTDTVEVDEPRVEVVVAGAMYYMSRILWQRSSTHDRTRFREDMVEFKKEWDELKREKAMPAMGAEIGGRGLLDPQYHFERRDGTYVLVLDRRRGSESGIGFSQVF